MKVFQLISYQPLVNTVEPFRKKKTGARVKMSLADKKNAEGDAFMKEADKLYSCCL